MMVRKRQMTQKNSWKRSILIKYQNVLQQLTEDWSDVTFVKSKTSSEPAGLKHKTQGRSKQCFWISQRMAEAAEWAISSWRTLSAL